MVQSGKSLGGRESGKPRCILVVDDEPGFRDMLQWYLQSHDFQVEVARNGTEALERASKEEFSLVVTDLTMPSLDGLKLLEGLKDKNPQTEVIIMTGFGTVETAVDAIKRGAFDFVLKPFNLESMTSRIKKALGEE